MNLLTLITLFLLADIRLPTRTESVTPEPVPVAVEVRVDTIRPGEIYIVQSDSECIIREFPSGLLRITSLAGPRPLGISGVFAGGDPDGEIRIFEYPHLYSIRGVASGTTAVQFIPLNKLIQSEADAPLLVLTVQGANPPPIVDPPVIDPPIVDPPTPPPVPIGKLQVLIIEDPAQKASLPSTQITILDGQTVRKYLDTHCTITDGTPDRRFFSVRQVVTEKSLPWIQEAFAVPRDSLPWIVILRGSKTISGPLPETVDETMALLRTYGGP